MEKTYKVRITCKNVEYTVSGKTREEMRDIVHMIQENCDKSRFICVEDSSRSSFFRGVDVDDFSVIVEN